MSGLDLPGYDLEENIRRLARAPLRYFPGTAWSYSLATDALGLVIERAADAPLPETVLRYVTGPLGMRDTTFVVAQPDRLSRAHRDGEGGREAVRFREGGDWVPIG